jgi:hypothetical protein
MFVLVVPSGIPKPVPRSGLKSSGFGIAKVGIRDLKSVRDPFQYFFCGSKATRDIIICKYFEQKMYYVDSHPKLTKLAKFLLFKIKNLEAIFNPDPDPELIPKF